MKIRFKLFGVFFIIIFQFVISCNNRYEKQIVGFYKIDKYEKEGKEILRNFPTLLLSGDKTFILTAEQKKIEGKWEADDLGDWIAVNFYFEKNQSQGVLLGEHLERVDFVSPLDFGIDATKCTFLKVDSK